MTIITTLSQSCGKRRNRIQTSYGSLIKSKHHKHNSTLKVNLKIVSVSCKLISDFYCDINNHLIPIQR